MNKGNDMDHDYIQYLKDHPTIKLLRVGNSPLVISFFFLQFKKNNRIVITNTELTTNLADYLYSLREKYGETIYTDSVQKYLSTWTNEGFLRKYYLPASDEPVFELTPATEKALDWIKDLEKKEFVGTESRLLTIFDLLREIVYKSSVDPHLRLEELTKQKQEIDQEIAKLEAGVIERLNETQIKERFIEVRDAARKLLGDFRQIEYNFRELDRTVREKQADNSLKTGKLLDDVFKGHDLIRDTDQGRSFRAFWEFLMSQAKQDELDQLIASVNSLPEIQELNDDEFINRLKVGLIESGDKVNKTNHRLIAQLRKYLDDKVALENKRIIEIIREIKSLALQVRNEPPKPRDFFAMDGKPSVDLIMERPLWDVPKNPEITDTDFIDGRGDAIDAGILYKQIFIDQEELKGRIKELLKVNTQVSLRQISEAYPIEKGLAEVITFLNIASKDKKAAINNAVQESISVANKETNRKFEINLPQVVFCR